MSKWLAAFCVLTSLIVLAIAIFRPPINITIPARTEVVFDTVPVTRTITYRFVNGVLRDSVVGFTLPEARSVRGAQKRNAARTGGN
jgi:hypothetical protein